MNELTGQTLLRRYRVDRFIGRGGMAEVYEAWDEKEKRVVALKVLHENSSYDPVFLRRFKHEASVLSQLEHPNIMQYYGLEERRGLAFMVVEFIDGLSLRQVLSRPMTLAQAAAILEPVCDALEYAHQQGIWHCDIKPANILIERGGRVVLADFGIARWAESGTTTFAGAGTAAYMSPEQCRGRGLSAQTDIYGLSITLYEMLTYDRPFVGKTGPPDSTQMERVRWEQLNAPPPSPRSLNSQVSPSVEQVILTGLSKEPAQRQQTPLEFYHEFMASGIEPDRISPWDIEETLLPARNSGQIRRPPIKSVGLISNSSAVSTPLQPALRRSPLLVSLTVVGALLLVIVAALFLSSRMIDFTAQSDQPLITLPFFSTSPTPTSTATVTATIVPLTNPPIPPSPTSTEVVVVAPPTPTATATLVPSTIYIEYVVDASNSMLAPMSGNQSKLEVVRAALAQQWQTFQPPPHIGLRAYGHQHSAIDVDASCIDTELLAPASQGQVDQLISLLHDITAHGMSPLTEALREASSDFTFVQERSNAMILIADGGDNCKNNNPCQMVRFQREAGIRYPIYVIGLNVDEASRDSLTCLAEESEGLYRDATSEQELIHALEEFQSEIAR